MKKRKVIFKPVIQLRDAEKAAEKVIDEWVGSSSLVEEENGSAVNSLQNDFRFTIVIPEFLHRRIKKYCAVHGVSIKQKLTEIFEKEFPET